MLAQGSFGFERAQPHHFALVLAYGLGEVASEAAGSGFRHTMTPLSGDLEAGRSNPSFTCAQRYGGVLKRRFASCFIDRLTATFARDEWCRLKASVVATGKCSANLVEDELTASRTATELTLTQAAEGATGALRLDGLHRVRAELAPGEWHEVAAAMVSAATPARVGITPPGGSGDCRYRVLYVAKESGWMAFPGPLAESPLHISQVSLTVGGLWDGTAVQGGRPVAGELRRLEWTLNNHFDLAATPGVQGFAGLALRGRREQRLTLSRDMRCGSLQRQLEAGETMCVQIICQGAEFAPGEPYRVEVVWPRVALLACSVGAAGQRLTEEAVCLPLEGDDTPSVVARVTNAQATCAA
jgi:hypothetical protein